MEYDELRERFPNDPDVTTLRLAEVWALGWDSPIYQPYFQHWLAYQQEKGDRARYPELVSEIGRLLIGDDPDTKELGEMLAWTMHYRDYGILTLERLHEVGIEGDER